MIHDACRNRHRLLCRVRKLFIAETPSRQHWKTPHVSREPAFRVWLPYATIFGYRMAQTLCALVRLANRVVSKTLSLGKPQQWFIMSGERFGVSRKAVFVVPNDLPPIAQAEFVEVALNPAQVVMNAVNEDAAA